jgi:YidC/Oxa1 family membrane protein insertase
MKVLRPEINELGRNSKKDPMKKQQETMKLYNSRSKPMAGCVQVYCKCPSLCVVSVFLQQ